MTAPSPASRRQNGSALLVVLWTLVPLAALATMLTSTGRTEAQVAGNLHGAAVAQAAADGAVHAAIMALLSPTGTESGSLSWPPSPEPRTERVAGARTSLRIGSEDGKFDLNAVPPDVLAALLQALGTERDTARQLAVDIVLWRSQSLEATARERAYAQAGLGYVPPGAPYQSVSELASVLGMTPALMERLRPYLTVYRSGDPDLRSADPIVRGILGGTSGTAGGAPGRSAVLPPALAPSANRVRVAVIDATATADRGGVASRHTIVRVGASSDRGGWTVLVWE